MARVLAKWPTARALFGDLEKAPSIPRGPRRRAEKRRHIYRWTGEGWQCAACLRRALASSSAQGRCSRPSAKLKDLTRRAAELGHQLWFTKGHRDVALVFCRACGLYSGGKCCGLGRPCRGGAEKNTRGHHNLGKFLREKGSIHPVTGAGLEDPWPAEAGGKEWWIKSRGAATQGEASDDANDANANAVSGGPVGNQNEQFSTLATGHPAGEEEDGAEVHAQDEGRNITRRAGFDDPEAFWSDIHEGEESPW